MTEDEIGLWHRCRQGEAAAREKLILRYAPEVAYWVNQIRQRAPWANPEDLMQDGTIGLIRAVDKFEAERGWEFSTFARYHIWGKIFDSLELTRGLPRRQEEITHEVREVHDKLAKTLGRKPTTEEIGRELGLSISQVTNAMKATAIAFAAGLAETESDVRLGMRSEPTRNPTTGDQERRILIQDALSRLDEREAFILIRHGWYGESDSEIAKGLAMTPGAVSKARQRAMKKLRTLLE